MSDQTSRGAQEAAQAAGAEVATPGLLSPGPLAEALLARKRVQRRARRGAVQRAVAEGWGAGSGANEKQSQVGGVRRVPVSGVSSVASGKAIVFIAPSVKEDQPIEVLVHLHGWGGALKGARDISVDLMEQQVEASGRPMVGVMPQAVDAQSKFGKDSKDINADVFVAECLGFAFPKKVPAIQRTVLSAHSGGGDAASQMLNSGNAPGKLGEVALFEAINGPEELKRIEDFVGARLDQDLGALKARATEEERREYLRGSLRFRAYYNKGGLYADRIGNTDDKKDFANAAQKGKKIAVPSLRVFLNRWFKAHEGELGGKDGAVYQGLAANYQAIEVADPAKPTQKGENLHDNIIGAGDHMKDALGALPAYQPNPPAPVAPPAVAQPAQPAQPQIDDPGDAGAPVGTGPDEADG